MAQVTSLRSSQEFAVLADINTQSHVMRQICFCCTCETVQIFPAIACTLLMTYVVMVLTRHVDSSVHRQVHQHFIHAD